MKYHVAPLIVLLLVTLVLAEPALEKRQCVALYGQVKSLLIFLLPESKLKNLKNCKLNSVVVLLTLDQLVVLADQYYSQCLVGSSTSTSTKTTTTTTTTIKTTTTTTTTAAAATATSKSRTTAPSGCISVCSTCSYKTITSAISSLGSGTSSKCIFIYSGTYNEQITINYGGPLTLYGYTTDVSNWKSNTVTITNGISSPVAGSLVKSATVNVDKSNFASYNIIFVNSYGSGAQAVAVSANGNYQGYYGCSFKGYQDTLYVKSGYQYYSYCYIEGAVDYIFGDASVWFNQCTIASNGPGAITASSRELSTDQGWYVFDSSTITAASGVTGLTSKVFLGRPWRVLARVMYQRSSLSNIINAAGWTTMAENATPIYEEYQNTGAGSSTASRKYTTLATGFIQRSTVLGSSYASWVDSSY
ncbi:hypothetical protein HK096_009088 [Nowakowskiella sp. JEL0078]|nr:hypothetical protein HK096_009088 [Nowakowskiella sp. JEL0078]